MKHIDELEAIEEELKKLKEVFPDDMKAAVLQTAMQGKLTEQLETDSSVDDLLEDIKKEREKLVKEGKIKKSRIIQNADFVGFNDNEMPFEIPDNWRWVRLVDVSIIQEGAGIRKFQYTSSGVQLLCVTNITNNGVFPKLKEIFVSMDEYLQKYQHLTLQKGDIVTACSGGSWGKVCEYTIDDKMMLNTSTLRMRFFNDVANNKYLLNVCRSEFFKQQLREQLSGMQPNFGYAHYSQIMFPLPPLEEQNRIVAKLEQILPLIVDLS